MREIIARAELRRNYAIVRVHNTKKSSTTRENAPIISKILEKWLANSSDGK
jgi:hypothetical protein